MASPCRMRAGADNNNIITIVLLLFSLLTIGLQSARLISRRGSEMTESAAAATHL